jgi:uncharacterized protein (UPF0332 family)
MHWREFQLTAERLAQGSSEGDWRSAVSRRYYAVFHFFRDFLLSHGLDVSAGAQSHFNVYSGLLHCGFPSVGTLASRTDAVRQSRAWCDYDLRQSIRQAFAQRQVQEAASIVADFQAILTTVPAAPIVLGARQHLQLIGRLPKTP